MLTAPVTWNSVINNSVLKNCGIFVTDNDGWNLLGDTNISKFTCRSRNCWVCEKIPTDDCYIDIIEWDSLNSTQQTYLSTKSNIVKVGYGVGGVTTLKARPLVIDSIKIDRHQKTAQLHLVSPFSLMTSTSKIDLSRTWGEREQLMAVSSIYGIRIPNLGYNALNPEPLTIVNDEAGLGVQSLSCGISHVIGYSTSQATFNSKNIYDWNYVEDEDKSDTVIYGRETGTETPFGISSYTEDGLVFYQAGKVYVNFNYSTEYIFTRYSIETKLQGIGDWTFLQDVSASDFDAMGLTGIYDEPAITIDQNFDYRFTLRGFQVNMASIPANVSTHYIQTPYLQNGSNQHFIVQMAIFAYYSNTKMVEIDCRIDPRFEPLDVITCTLDTTTCVLCIEEIYIEFDGGFSGKIIGRVISES